MVALYTWFATRMDALRARSERGAAAVEYGLLVGIIAVGILAAVTLLRDEINGTFCAVVNALPGTQTCS